MMRFFQGFRRDAHPMSVMVASVGALSAFYHDSIDIADENQRMIASMRMIAKFPTLAAMAYKYSVGQPFVYPRNDLSYTANFLRMTFGVPAEEYIANEAVVRALDLLFILHGDHEQNCSTSTVRMVGSSHATLFASVSAGINALFGPLHGGANTEVLKTLVEIGSVENVGPWVDAVRAKKGKFMGFGHAVYKNFDPRARIIGEADLALQRWMCSMLNRCRQRMHCCA